MTSHEDEGGACLQGYLDAVPDALLHAAMTELALFRCPVCTAHALGACSGPVLL